MQERKIVLSGNDEYCVDISFTFNPPGEVFEKVEKAESEPRHLYDLKLQFYSLSLLRGLEELLCLDILKNVDKY